MKKRSFTLLEVVIALGLAAILFTALFGRMKHLFVTNQRLEKATTQVLAQKHVHERLSLLFHTLDLTNQGKKEPPLSSKDGTKLKIRFDNGVQRDRTLSGYIEGTIEIEKNDKQKNLVINILDTEGNTHREPLFTNILDAKWTFYDRTQKKKGWVNSWNERVREFPPMIKLQITIKNPSKEKKSQKTHTYTFPFFISSQDNIINYTLPPINPHHTLEDTQ